MNAKEAREKAELVKNIENTPQVKDILDLITKSVNKGEFTIIYYKDIPEKVNKYLEDKGFDIIYQYIGRNEFFYKISW